MLLPLVAELKRRRVFRALVVYGVVAFAVLQVIEPVMHGLHWPEAVLSYVVVALAIGFPIVVGLAWAFDVNAGRMERIASIDRGERSLRGARLAVVLAAIGVLAAAPGTFYYFRVSAGRNAAGKRIQVYRSGSTRKEVLAEYARVLLEIRQQRFVAPKSITVNAYLDAWERAHGRDLEAG